MKLLIDTNWAAFIEDLPVEKQLEFFWAIFDYGRDCSLKCWSKIQPELERGKIKYYNRLNNLKQYNTERVSESDTESESESVPEWESEREYKYKTQIETNSRNNGCYLSTTRTRVKGFTPPTLEQVLDYAKQQNDIAGMGGFACTPELADQFWTYYESQGWIKGNSAKTPISDWKPLLRRWATDEHNKLMAEKAKEEPFYL